MKQVTASTAELEQLFPELGEEVDNDVLQY
jgi:hypothetical protein